MKYYLGILFISFISTAEQSVRVTKLTNQIYRRMYCIEQVNQSVDYIKDLNLATYPSLIRTIIWEYKTFEHYFYTDIIKKVFQSIAEEKSLNAFFLRWTDFERYKYLENTYFSQDIVRMLFIIAKSLCMASINENELLICYVRGITLCQCLETALDLATDQLVEIISVIIKFCQSDTKDFSYLCEEVQERLGFATTKHDDLVEVGLHVGSQEVLMRFYYIQRLECFREIISHYCHDSVWGVSEEIPVFTNHCVKKTFDQLKTNANLFPLLDLLDDFTHYKNAYDMIFNREAILLFFLTLKQIVYNQFLASHPVNKRRGFIEQIMALYKDIDMLPIEEILDAIDLTIDALDTLAKEERVNGRKNIFQKTWWVKTIGIFLIILKVIHHYHYYY